MGWTAILGAVLTLAVEIFKLIREVRVDKKEENLELKKRKTEILQKITRGIVDRDDERINSGFDELRRMRENK